MANAAKDAGAMFRLYLTKEEAETVAVVLGRIGGSPIVTPRKHADAVLDALRGAGVTTCSDDPGYKIHRGHPDAIYFEPPPLRIVDQVHGGLAARLANLHHGHIGIEGHQFGLAAC
jgi:hypothetical protein